MNGCNACAEHGMRNCISDTVQLFEACCADSFSILVLQDLIVQSPLCQWHDAQDTISLEEMARRSRMQ